MASTYSPLLRFELIGSGDQSGLWGTTTNGNLGSLVEQAVAGVASIVLTSSADYTLQSLNGTSDEARCAVLSFSGSPGGATNIIIPASQKLYVVRNGTGQTLTVKTSAQVGGVTVLDANATLVFCNGINALAGIQSSSTANVTGPASSTANAIARYNGTTGQLLKNSVGATIDDTGAPTFTGIIQANPVSTTVGASIRLLEGSTSGTNYVSFKAPNTLTADVTWTLPSADATVAGQVLTSNAAGTLSWTTAAAGSGTVTSVGISGTNITVVSGSPVTTAGTIAISIPQAITTTSSVQFGSFGVGTPASGTTGEIRATNNVTAFYSSDIKFKQNVRPIPDALATVSAIGGKLFDWTDEYLESKGGVDGYFVQKADFGVIAQDVQKVFPIAVREREDGTLAVDYEKLGVLAFAALVELTKRVEALETR
jgi:hypothetical protein